MSEVTRGWRLALWLLGGRHEILTMGEQRTQARAGLPLAVPSASQFLSKAHLRLSSSAPRISTKDLGFLFPYIQVNRLESVGPEWHLKSS